MWLVWAWWWAAGVDEPSRACGSTLEADLMDPGHSQTMLGGSGASQRTGVGKAALGAGDTQPSTFQEGCLVDWGPVPWGGKGGGRPLPTPALPSLGQRRLTCVLDN